MTEIANPCTSCGACCAYFRVSFYWAETGDGSESIPAESVAQISPHRVCMLGTDKVNPRCICLEGNIGGAVRCNIYRVRPTPCREFEASWLNGIHNPDCDKARAAHGMLPLEKSPTDDSDIPDPGRPGKVA